MPETQDKSPATAPARGSVAAAMNHVLEAERAALAELQACRAEAEKTLESARREARSILERAERIARDIHGRTERLATARARRLVEQAGQQHGGPDPEEILATAVTQLAAKMTGGEHA